jgi:hypothetical protein
MSGSWLLTEYVSLPYTADISNLYVSPADKSLIVYVVTFFDISMSFEALFGG